MLQGHKYLRKQTYMLIQVCVDYTQLNSLNELYGENQENEMKFAKFIKAIIVYLMIVMLACRHHEALEKHFRVEAFLSDNKENVVTVHSIVRRKN